MPSGPCGTTDTPCIWFRIHRCLPFGAFGDTPLVAISATRKMDDMPEGFLESNHAMHGELAALCSQGRHVKVAGADHFSVLMNREHALRTGMTSPPAATRLLLRRSLSGARALPHERRGHVAPRRTRMLFGNVRGKTIRRDLLPAEPAEGLTRRDVDALHSAPACAGRCHSSSATGTRLVEREISRACPALLIEHRERLQRRQPGDQDNRVPHIVQIRPRHGDGDSFG
jgi:hypothetical protein